MRNLLNRICIKALLFIAILLLGNLNLSAQYKLELDWQKTPGGGANITSLALTNNDSTFFISTNSTICEIRKSNGETIRIIPTEYNYGRLIISKDGKTIIVATGNAGENGIGLLEPSTFKRTLWLNYPNFTDITYNDKQNKFVANYSPDIRVYDVATQKLDKEFNTGLALNQANLTDDGKYLVYSYRKYTTKPDKIHYFIRILDLDGKLIKEVKELSSGIFTFTNEGKTLIYFDSFTIHFFDLETMKENEGIPLGGLDPSGIEMSNDGKFMLLGGNNSESGIKFYDLITKKYFLLYPFGTWRNFKLQMDNTSLFWALSDLLYKFNLTPNTSIIDLRNKLDLSLNIIDNKLILSNPQNLQINTLTAYDILGRTYPLSVNGNDVDVSALAAGKYFLKVGLADCSFLDFSFVKE